MVIQKWYNVVGMSVWKREDDEEEEDDDDDDGVDVGACTRRNKRSMVRWFEGIVMGFDERSEKYHVHFTGV